MTSFQWRTTSRESAGRHTTSYDSCGRYVSHSRWNHVKLSSTRLCPADSTTVTVCFRVSKNFNSICCSLSFVPLLAWFSVSGNSIRSPWKFATSCIGSLWGRGSNSRFVRWFTNFYTEELHLSSLRWCCQSLTHQPCDVCDFQQGATSSKTVRFDPRSFNVSGPTLWNSLPLNIRQCKSFESFRKQLKTFLYLRVDST